MLHRITAALLAALLVSLGVPAWGQQSSPQDVADAFRKALGLTPPSPAPADGPPHSPGNPGSDTSLSHRFMLSGVIVTDRTRMALLHELGASVQAPRLMHVGDALGGYRITDIEADRVMLEGPAGSIVVRLGSGGGTGEAAAVSAAGSAGESRAATMAPQPAAARAPASAPPHGGRAPAPVVVLPPARTDGAQQAGEDRTLTRQEVNDLKRQLQQAQRQQRSRRTPHQQVPSGGAASAPSAGATE